MSELLPPQTEIDAMKNVVISGGSSGIGLATAQRFSQSGYHVYIFDLQPPQQFLPNATFIQCDVTKITEINNAASQVNKIEALVCNAGIHFSGTIANTTEDDFEKVIAINLKGSFFLVKAFLPIMIRQNKGSIVFVGSDQTLIGKTNSAIYGATKAALGSLAKTTALDYAKYGIRSNLVAAGTIDTPLYQKAIKSYSEHNQINLNEIQKMEASEQPLGRVGQAIEVANLIYFLCSDEASFMTGGIYPVDGGYTAK